MITRRQSFKTAAFGAALIATTRWDRAFAQALPAPPPPTPTGPHKLPALGYSVDALEPHIDAQTMQIHHGKHHMAYVGNLNKAIAEAPELAAKSAENTGEELLSVLERRLDNVIHRLGFAPSRNAARQLVNAGHVLLNDKPCDIPSALMRPGDTVKVKSRERSVKLARELMREGAKERIPDFLEVIPGEIPEGRLTRMPARSDVDPRIGDIREQMIIEIVTR